MIISFRCNTISSAVHTNTDQWLTDYTSFIRNRIYVYTGRWEWEKREMTKWRKKKLIIKKATTAPKCNHYNMWECVILEHQLTFLYVAFFRIDSAVLYMCVSNIWYGCMHRSLAFWWIHKNKLQTSNSALFVFDSFHSLVVIILVYSLNSKC